MDTAPQDPSRRRALRQLGTGIGALALWPYVSEEGAQAFARIQVAVRQPAPRAAPRRRSGARGG